MKRCPRCNIIKPLIDFNRRTGRPASSYCRECNKQVCKEYDLNRRANDLQFVESERLRAQAKRHNNKERRIGQIFNSVKTAALKRGLNFNITKAQIHVMLEIQKWKCVKTGIDFDLTAGNGTQPFGPTIDRIVNSIGYEPNNIQLVCNIYNFAKNKFTDDDVLLMARQLVERAT